MANSLSWSFNSPEVAIHHCERKYVFLSPLLKLLTETAEWYKYIFVSNENIFHGLSRNEMNSLINFLFPVYQLKTLPECTGGCLVINFEIFCTDTKFSVESILLLLLLFHSQYCWPSTGKILMELLKYD